MSFFPGDNGRGEVGGREHESVERGGKWVQGVDRNRRNRRGHEFYWRP